MRSGGHVGISHVLQLHRWTCRAARFALSLVVFSTVCLTGMRPVCGQLRTWDSAHRIDDIEVTLVYFVPKDVATLPDWKGRLQYYAQRIEQFHRRELDGQSTLTTRLPEAPFRSTQTVAQLRAGDADAVFFKTLGEVDKQLMFGQGPRTAFPILLVLSEINWKSLDDFYRVKPAAGGQWMFEGNYRDGRHYPGAESGGARAVYLSDRGVGWGLVSGDGWRVPYSGSDCVVYHEGVGHAIGLPHNEPPDGAVMSLGQYNGWINQSWLDEDQKKRLGWVAPESREDQTKDLFTCFTAIAEPAVPKPDENVSLKLTWPKPASMKQLRVQIQTDLLGPWVEVPLPPADAPPDQIALGKFDRATPVSYRIDAELSDAQRVELWGYFQVRENLDEPPQPRQSPATAVSSLSNSSAASNSWTSKTPMAVGDSIDLLDHIDAAQQAIVGTWTVDKTILTSPKAFGARLELPLKKIPEPYELIVIAEPLDEPNGLILGQKMSDQRFLVLMHFQSSPGNYVSALENVDGNNFALNPTRLDGPIFEKNRLSEIVVRVQKDAVTVDCDGRNLIRWQGQAGQLSLSDYWTTPNSDALFLGTYDCRYRFHRVTLRALERD